MSSCTNTALEISMKQHKDIRGCVFIILTTLTALTPVQYDGEKDTRTPHDFINHSNAKHDDVIEGEDDEPEDEDTEPALARNDGMMKRGGNAVPKVEPGTIVKQSPNGSNGLSMPNVCVSIHRSNSA